MKFINNILYIEFSELVDAGVSEYTLKTTKRRNSPSWNFIDDPQDKRKVLIHYDSLKPKYKALVAAKFGNPYTFAGQKQIKDYITTDHDALQTLTFFKFHTTGKGLSADQINELSIACDVLNFLAKSTKPIVKQLGFDGMPSFYETIITYIKQEKISLPTSYSRLREAVREYAATGAESVISGRFGNQNNRKVTDETSLALLQQLIAHPHRFGDVIVCMKYNQWAAENNKPTISEATVGNYRRTHEKELLLTTEGTAAWRNKYDKVVHRLRPSAPLLLINSDDNTLDLYFVNDKTKYYRPVVYVVIDAYNDMPLGYAIGDLVTKDLVREAYRNAANYVRQLTGDNYLWHQIVTDRWGLDPQLKGDLATFFSQQAKFTPAKFKNSRNKVIEQSFGKNWHNKLKFHNNYSGHNITAVTKTNTEALELTKKDWPTVEEMKSEIDHFIYKIRNTKDAKTQLSKQDVWLNGWNQMTIEARKLITKEQHLLYFGIQRNLPSTITNRGIEFKIKGYSHIYDVDNNDYARFVGMTGNIIYDPYDLNTILFTADEGRVRIVAHAYEKVPMALYDFNEGDRTNLNKKLNQKKEFSQNILDSIENRKSILQRSQIDAESVLQAGELKKELRIAAERKLIQTDRQIDNGEFDADEYLLSQL